MILVGAYKDTDGKQYIAFMPEDKRPRCLETPPRYCACGNELTPAERDRGERECEECR